MNKWPVLLSLLSLYFFCSACTKEENTTASSPREIETRYTLEVKNSTKIQIAAAELRFFEFETCARRDDDMPQCDLAVLTTTKDFRLLSLHWKNLFTINPPQFPFSEQDFIRAARSKSISPREVVLDLKPVKVNFLRINAQHLARCRSAVYWQQLVDLALRKRSVVYLHYSSKTFSGSSDMIRVDTETGTIDIMKNPALEDSHYTDLSLILNAEDSQRKLLQDNALIEFTTHRFACDLIYENFRWSKTQFNIKKDEEASRILNDQLKIEISEFNQDDDYIFDTSGPDPAGIPDLLAIEVDTKNEEEYFHPTPLLDPFWRLFIDKENEI